MLTCNPQMIDVVISDPLPSSGIASGRNRNSLGDDCQREMKVCRGTRGLLAMASDPERHQKVIL